MSIFSDLGQILRVLGAYFIVLSGISIALPLVLGLFARRYVFTSDTDDAGVDGAANTTPSASRVSQPDFKRTDWRGRFKYVNILAPEADVNRANPTNGKQSESLDSE